MTGLYPVSKTLSFQLNPVGRTLEHIETAGIIEIDEQRHADLVKAKTVLDRYHKTFLRHSLKDVKLKPTSDGHSDSLEDFARLAVIKNRDEDEAKEWDAVRQALRMQIVKAFQSSPSFPCLFKKELFGNVLTEMVLDDEERSIIEGFSKYTGYFDRYHAARKNLYSVEEKRSAVAYRLINENLPVFIDNIRRFDILASSEIASSFPDIMTDFDGMLNVNDLREMFRLDYYSDLLTQLQIEVYNSIINGYVTEQGEKVKGLNEYVNLYNQSHPDSPKLPLLKPLFKMLLSDRVQLSWIPTQFDSDNEMTDAVRRACRELKGMLAGGGDDLRSLLTGISAYDTAHIYVASGKQLSDLSHAMTGKHDLLENLIMQDLCLNVKKTPKDMRNPEYYIQRIRRIFNSRASFSIDYLNGLIGDADAIQSYYASLGLSAHSAGSRLDVFTRIEVAELACSDILSGKAHNLRQDETAIAAIKELMESYKALQRFIRPLLGSDEDTDADPVFNTRLSDMWSQLEVMTPLYDKVRNWLTRKPYSIEKIRLNFGSSTFLGGWDMDKTAEYLSVLLRKNGCYYLAILNPTYKKVFGGVLPSDGDCYEKMDFKQIKDPFKSLPHKFFSAKGLKNYAPPQEIMDIYNNGTYKKGDSFSLDDCHKLIDFYKSAIAKTPDWAKFGFSFSDTSTYGDINAFYTEVDEQSYYVNFRPVSAAYINQMVDDGRLYLFQLWNKDMSPYSTGRKDPTTMYWNALFHRRNLDDPKYQLTGGGQVFFRRHSIVSDTAVRHRAGQVLPNKNPASAKKESVFRYDIIKDRRYTVDQFQLHVGITVFPKSERTEYVNNHIRSIVRNGGIRHVIGIHRGEKNLLYAAVTDLKGRIVLQRSLNVVISEHDGVKHECDYRQLLTQRAGNRLEARRNWQRLDDIKNLKSGYLSQMVSIISSLVLQYDAIVVLEDLDTRFRQERQCIESNVYMHFEEALIRKLNCYVSKTKSAVEAGGIMKPLQLTGKFKSLSGIGCQSGVVFLYAPWKTKRMDPVTGFVSQLDARYQNVGSALLFFNRFDSIRYSADHGWFEFDIDYDRDLVKTENAPRSSWTLCSHGTRHRLSPDPQRPGRWQLEEVDLSAELKKVLTDAGVGLDGELVGKICQIREKKHLEPLMNIIGLMLQMSYVSPDCSADYIVSPVQDSDGHFFDSRHAPATMPENADSNAAYNLARRGLYVIDQMSRPDDVKLTLGIGNSQWLSFVQRRPYLDDSCPL